MLFVPAAPAPSLSLVLMSRKKFAITRQSLRLRRREDTVHTVRWDDQSTDLAFKLWIVSTRLYAVTAYFSRRDLVWPRALYHATQSTPFWPNLYIVKGGEGVQKSGNFADIISAWSLGRDRGAGGRGMNEVNISCCM